MTRYWRAFASLQAVKRKEQMAERQQRHWSSSVMFSTAPVLAPPSGVLQLRSSSGIVRAKYSGNAHCLA
jgi:hypothetical protein